MKTKVKVKKEGKSAFKKFKNRLSFFIVLVFAAFVFYLGWIQIKIPEGKYALVYTKTGGYDSTLIAPGQFVWRWENLLPQNMTIHFLELKQQREELKIEGFLPSGELYGEYINKSDAFRYLLDVSYTFSLKDDQVRFIVESEAFSPQALDEQYALYRQEANSLIETILLAHTPFRPEDIQDVESTVAVAVAEADSRFNVDSLKLRTFRYPDFLLYEKTREYFLNELALVREVELKAEQKSAVIENETMRKMDLLRLYGEILSEFPVLLEYYELDRDKIDPSLLKNTGMDTESP